MKRNCEVCRNVFTTYPSKIAVGHGRFCSKVCKASVIKCRQGRKPARPLAVRFWDRVDKDGPTPAHAPHLGPCWVYGKGRIAEGQYGRVRIDARTICTAHRYCWEQNFGAVPANLHVLHHCDNRVCVRPGHLFLGSNIDNVRDKVVKGRGTKGRTWKQTRPRKKKGHATPP